MRSIEPVVALLAGIGCVGLPGTVYAQTAAPGTTSPDTRSAADVDDAQTIIVTGSRVTNGNNSPTPVTVVSQDALQDIRPSTLADTLQSIPIFAGSRSVLNNPFATGGSGAGNGVANQINLRNVGSQRNLVLMDGHRLPPTSTNNVVDIDMIPQIMLDRVETVTGGTSAVYGSDAVTGVVNFITKKNFEGLKVDGHYGISQQGDDAQVDGAVAFGTKLGPHGHFEASYEYRDDKGILYRSDRDWYQRTTIAGNGTAAVPYVLVNNGTLPATPFGGRITCSAPCTVNGQYFATNGVLSPFVDGQPVVANGTTISGIQIGGAGGYYDSSLKAPLRSHQAFARFDYELGDSINFFVIGSANFKRNVLYEIPLTISNLTLRSTNAFLTPAQSAALLPGGPTFKFGSIAAEAGRFSPLIDSTQYLVTTGLNGKVAQSFPWNLTYTHGYSKLDVLLRNNVNEQKLRASLDAVNVGGSIVCGINADAIASNNDPGCVPFNAFGPTAASAGAMNYVMDDTRYLAFTTQDDVTADISGSPFSNWAGPVTVALSAEWRRQAFSAQTQADSNALANCAGLLDCIQGRQPLWRQSFAASPQVSDTTREAAVEVEFPLLKDARFAQLVSVNGAARYTDYKSVGSYWTWKLGASWEIDDSLRIRGTLSRDIRAPTLNDLYAPVSIVVNAQTDLLLPGSPSYAVEQDTVGNPNLKAEIGHTWTIGAVWKPSFLPRFSASVDYYNIKIDDAIILAPGFSPLYQQACYASGGISQFCALQVRPLGFANTTAANQVTKYYVEPFNIGQIETYGVDVELNYVSSLFSRPLRLRLLSSWQPHIRYIQAGVPTTDQGGVAFGPVGMTASPKWRITGTVSYQPTDALRFDLQERWRSGLKFSNLSTDIFQGPNSIGSQGVTSLNIAYTIDSKSVGSTELFVNVQNLFDAQPPLANGTASAATPGRQNGFSQADDPVGRYFTMGVRAKF